MKRSLSWEKTLSGGKKNIRHLKTMQAKSSILYQGANCPCPADCVRHGNCKECIAFHHNRGQKTYCEQLSEKFKKEVSTGCDAGLPLSGKEIRLLDYTKCEYCAKHLSVASNVDQRRVKLMTEAQTSGGLLIFISCAEAENAIDKLRQCGDVSSNLIGEVTHRNNDDIFLKVY